MKRYHHRKASYILIFIFAFSYVSAFGQGEKPLFAIEDACGFRGYVDSNMNIIIRPQPEWTRVFDFYDGIANVEIKIEIGKNKKLNNSPIYKYKNIYINTKGETLLNC